MIKRNIEDKIVSILKWSSSVTLLGPRQIGKTTISKIIEKKLNKNCLYIDLEDYDELNKVALNKLFFEENSDKCIIIDEIQRYPQLFASLRSYIDKNRIPARFILLGSASPLILKNATESLTGRTIYLEINGINFSEVEDKVSLQNHWVRGGFPVPLQLIDKNQRILWFKSFIKNYIEYDLRQLGFDVPSFTINRLLYMIGTMNGSTWNSSLLCKSLSINTKQLSIFRDYLEKTYLIRVLRPYFSNTKKRLIKSPKIYIRDSGILNFLNKCYEYDDLLKHPIIGLAWEGYVIEQIINYINNNCNEDYDYAFYRTTDGSEIDFIILKGIDPYISIEIKLAPVPKLTRGVTEGIKYLNTKKNYIIIPKCEYPYTLSNGFRVTTVLQFLKEFNSI